MKRLQQFTIRIVLSLGLLVASLPFYTNPMASLASQSGVSPGSNPTRSSKESAGTSWHGLVAPSQTEDDFYYFDGERVPVTIALDQIGVVAIEGVGRERIIGFASELGLQVIAEFPGGFFVLGLSEPLAREALVQFVREVKSQGEDLIGQAGLVVTLAGSETPMIMSDEFIAGFVRDAQPEEIDAFNAANGVEIKMAYPIVANWILLTVMKDVTVDALKMANLYYESDLTEFAYPNFIGVYFDTETILNDTLFGDQWHLANTGQSGGTVDADSDSSWAWDITQGSPATVIAVLENGGFDMTHPDLTPNFWVNPGETPANGVDDDSNSYIDDVNGWDFVGCSSASLPGCGDNNPSPAASEDHGTAVAGVAGARGNNMMGVSGSCPNCSLLFLRTGYISSDFAKSLAFAYAQQMGARIITNSWGGGGATPFTVTAINNATAAGVVVLFAAGNTTNNVCAGTTLDPRVSLPGVIAVSSSSNQDRKVVVSANGNCIDILAPSHRGYSAGDPYVGTLNVTTSDRTGTAGYNNTNPVTNCPTTEDSPPPTNARDYTHCFGGTSSATPLTAGVVGLLLTVNSTLTRIQVQRLLQDTADKIEDSAASYSTNTGFSSPPSGVATHSWGRINAFEAVRIAAPVSQGGKGGVDVFFRDNRLDWGNTTGYLGEQASNVLFESTRGFIGHWRSQDIKVDAPPYQTAPTAATFDSFTDETPSAVPGEVNRVFVRVRNRGPVTASSVTVKLLWAQFGTALPALSTNFWTAFPGDPASTGMWNPLACSGSSNTYCTITNLGYSGSSVAGTGADAAQIMQFDFPSPTINPALSNHFCLLAIADSPQDPVDPASKMFVVDNITPNDNNVTHRNYRDLDSSSDESFAEGFFVRNPFEESITTQLTLVAPERWQIKLAPLQFNEPFELASGEEMLVAMNITLPELNQEGEVTVIQERVDFERMIMGGVTYRFQRTFWVYLPLTIK
jgi:hypothetical protein